MSRLLFAAARKARIEYYDNVLYKWERSTQVTLHETRVAYRIHPDDEHLQYGPISTALRDEAIDACALGRWVIADAFITEYITECDSSVVHSFVDTRMFLLILAEALADEGL